MNSAGAMQLHKLEHMQRHGMPLWRDILYVSMQACDNISAGRRIHSLMVASGFDSMSVLGDPLVRLFGSCESLVEANVVFCKIEQPSAFTWQSIIWTHSILGEHHRAYELYQQMRQQQGWKADVHTTSCILKSCGAFGVPWKGMFVHKEVLEHHFDSDAFVGSCLIDMYVKCGCLHEARSVFDNLSNRNEVVWNVMIAGYVQLGHGLVALHLLEKMQQDGMKPGKVTFLCILKVCQNEGGGLLWNRDLHSHILRGGLESDREIGSTLVDMYARWGSLEEAQVLFERMPNKNAVVWGAMISGYAQHSHGHLAVQMLEDMQRAGLIPDEVVFSSVLKAISSKEAAKEGMLLHSQIIIRGLDMDIVLQGSLVDMYVKCKSLDSAHRVFIMWPTKNVVTWSALIAGYAQYGNCSSALTLFIEMQQEGLVPDRVTFASILQACSCRTSATIAQGRLIHSQIVEMGFESDVLVANNLVRMFSKWGSLPDASNLFNISSCPDADASGELLSAYVQLGLDQLALKLFQRVEDEGIMVDTDVLVSILKSCGNLGDLSKGKMIHGQLTNKVYKSDIILGNALLDMYVNCGAWTEAHEVFSEMSSRDIVSWGIMMTGYIQCGYGHHALQLFVKMRQKGIEPDTVAFSCALKACCSIGSLDQGRVVHDWFLRSGLQLDLVAGNTLVDLYAKCGSLQDARNVFDWLSNRNEVSWNSMIAGYADHGMLKLAGECLFDMQGHDMRPSALTYSSMFAACSHAGHVDKGWAFFRSMTEDHHVAPTTEHFNGMADILARAGYLHEAEELLHVTPGLPDVPGWTSLLTACKFHSNPEVGQQCYMKIGLMDNSTVPGDLFCT